MLVNFSLGGLCGFSFFSMNNECELHSWQEFAQFLPLSFLLNWQINREDMLVILKITGNGKRLNAIRKHKKEGKNVPFAIIHLIDTYCDNS